MSNRVQPIHHDESTVSKLTGEIATACAIGAAQGALISITTGLILRWISPTYRNVRTPVRVFYHSAWISSAAVFRADRHLITFQNQYYEEEMRRRQRILDEAAERGIFLEEEAVAQSTTKGVQSSQ